MLIVKAFNPVYMIRALLEAFEMMKTHRELLVAMTMREVKDRYAGQALGAYWAVISPLLLMGVYLMAFGLIFKGRIGADDIGFGYVAYMIIGLAPWLLIAEAMSKAPTAISGHAGLVKQVVFPSEVLPMRVALSTFPTLLVAVITGVVVAAAGGLVSPMSILLLPLATLFLMVMLIGIVFLLAAVGVFMRDLKDLVSFFTSLGLFLHPILYPPASIPDWLSPLFKLSPFSYPIWSFRESVLGDFGPGPFLWVVFPLIALWMFSIGWNSFRALKPTFGNVL